MDASIPLPEERFIVFFDGHCVLCNATVDRLMRWDQQHLLRFASLSGETARALLGNPTGDSIIYLKGSQRYVRSEAVLQILMDIHWHPNWVRLAQHVPTVLRDGVYRVVAATRYRVFGKRDTCRVPSEAERGRILP